MACTEGDDGKVNELLEAGADPNVKVRSLQIDCRMVERSPGSQPAAMHVAAPCGLDAARRANGGCIGGDEIAVHLRTIALSFGALPP